MGARIQAPATMRSRVEAFGSVTGRDVLVAVIDSGWNRLLPDERVLGGIGLVDPDDGLRPLRSSDDHDRIGHGTLCARSVLEVAPDVRILPIRVFGRRLEGSLGPLAEALVHAGESRAVIVSMSLATHRTDAIRMLYPACESLAAAGAIVVAAAFRPNRNGFPAMFANVIGVEAAPVLGPFDYIYRPDSAIECGSDGRLDESAFPNLPPVSNSVAAARLAGILALYRESNDGGVDDARSWLARHSVQPTSNA